jgi:hypothetical protein
MAAAVTLIEQARGSWCSSVAAARRPGAPRHARRRGPRQQAAHPHRRYTETLRLMQVVGVDPQVALMRLPLELGPRRASTLKVAPSGAAALAVGLLGARGLGSDRLAPRVSFTDSAPQDSAAAGRYRRALLTARIKARCCGAALEPLCVSALNTPGPRLGASVRERVARHARRRACGERSAAPRTDLGALFQAGGRFVARRGASPPGTPVRRWTPAPTASGSTRTPPRSRGQSSRAGRSAARC